MGIYRDDLFSGKIAVVMGVADRWSIAWEHAQTLSALGAKLVLPYQGERVKAHVEELALSLPDATTIQADVNYPDQIDSLFELVAQLGGLDIFVHSIAYAPKEAMLGELIDTSADDFKETLWVSAGSLILLAKKCVPLMAQRGGGRIVTMTYLGGERVLPPYKVMSIGKAALEHIVRMLAYELGPQNITVNAISSGPVSTAAARGIPGFVELRRAAIKVAALRRGSTKEDLGHMLVHLCSEAGVNITGETIHVDAGSHLSPPINIEKSADAEQAPATSTPAAS